jgi:hypothetical protein
MLVPQLLFSTFAAFQPIHRNELDAALASWYADPVATEKIHGTLGTWDVSEIKEFFGSDEG